MNKSSLMTKKNEVERCWWFVDVEGKILGRAAARIAAIMRGKHKASFTPHVDCGDYVVVVNASKIKVTGNKLKEKQYYTFSGYPGGQKEASLETMLKKKPCEVMRRAVRRMLPRKPLYYSALKKLKVYADEKHPYGKKEFKPLEV